MEYAQRYKVCDITKKDLEEQDLFINFIEIDPNIKDEALEIINNNGYIIGLKNKKVLKSLCMFSYNKDSKYLKLFNLIQTRDVTIENIETFAGAIIEKLEEKVSLKEIEGIEWDDLFKAFEWLKNRFK